MANRPRDAFTSTLNEGNALRRHGPGAHKAKVAIRENLMEAMGEGVRVFDAYAGEGEMYRAVWSRAQDYIGCDELWYRDERTCYVADNRRVMRCGLDLTRFNVFDFDSFGSPYEPIHLLAARRPVQPGERIGLAITDGSGLRLKMGWIPDALAILSGLRRHMPGVSRDHETIIDRALSGVCRRMGCRIVKQWRAKGKMASGLWYLGVVIEGCS